MGEWVSSKILFLWGLIIHCNCSQLQLPKGKGMALDVRKAGDNAMVTKTRQMMKQHNSFSQVLALQQER